MGSQRPSEQGATQTPDPPGPRSLTPRLSRSAPSASLDVPATRGLPLRVRLDMPCPACPERSGSPAPPRRLPGATPVYKPPCPTGPPKSARGASEEGDKCVFRPAARRGAGDVSAGSWGPLGRFRWYCAGRPHGVSRTRTRGRRIADRRSTRRGVQPTARRSVHGSILGRDGYLVRRLWRRGGWLWAVCGGFGIGRRPTPAGGPPPRPAAAGRLRPVRRRTAGAGLACPGPR